MRIGRGRRRIETGYFVVIDGVEFVVLGTRYSTTGVLIRKAKDCEP